MPEVNLTQSMWKRAFQDTQEIIGSLVFWIVDILVSAIVGTISSNPWWGASAIIGIVAIVFLFELVRTPIRQRDEARKELRRIQETKRTAPITLNDFIEEGSKLRKSLFISWDSAQSEEKSMELNKWAQEVKASVTENFSQYAAHFISDGGLNGYAYTGPIIRSNLAVFMDRRLHRISEILMKIDS